MASVTVISPKHVDPPMPTVYYRLDEGPVTTVARHIEGLQRQVWTGDRWEDTDLDFDLLGRVISLRVAQAMTAGTDPVREALDADQL